VIGILISEGCSMDWTNGVVGKMCFAWLMVIGTWGPQCGRTVHGYDAAASGFWIWRNVLSTAVEGLRISMVHGERTMGKNTNCWVKILMMLVVPPSTFLVSRRVKSTSEQEHADYWSMRTDGNPTDLHQ
jgi:hypothetical protein